MTADRREEAGVPAGLIFRTKPELALEMVAGAVSERIPFRWVGGDSIYGNSPTFVQGCGSWANGTCWIFHRKLMSGPSSLK